MTLISTSILINKELDGFLMSKVIESSCVGGVVTAEGFPVTTAEIISSGVGQSDGVMLMEKDKQYYIPNTQPDLNKTLDDTIKALGKISDAINLICETMTAINNAHAGPATAPSPAVAPNVVQIQGMKTAIDTSKTALQTLKGNLI